MSSELMERDLKDIVLLEGETPIDIKQRCLKLCSNYLNGIWSELNQQNLVVKRISGGLSNMMFYCKAQAKDIWSGEQPTEVAIRLYGQKTSEDFLSRHNDSLISFAMSERRLGPQLFGSFPEGQIQQYIKHRQFGIKEQTNGLLVSELARKLAQLHSIRVPVNRNTVWLLDTIDKNVRKAYKKFPIKRFCEEYSLQSFKTNELTVELEWLRQSIESVNSPICFSHNDFRGNNIMVSEMFDQNFNSNESILFCDFEVSGYGYRGYDFGTLFAEWNRTDRYYRELQNFPDDSTIKPFIIEYIGQSIRIFGESYANNHINSFEHILKELKVFTLASYVLMLTACLAIDDYKQIGITKRDLMLAADIHFKNYINLKNKFIKDKSI